MKDDWKVNSRLTLNLGMRWEFNQPWKEARDRLALFDPNTGKLVTLGPNSPFGRGATEAYYRDFAPRIGFAWRPFGNEKTVVRGGYGIGFIPIDAFLISSNFRINPPFVRRLSFLSTTPVPNLTLANGFPQGSGIVSASASGIQRDWLDGYSQQFSFTVERVLASNTVLEVGYIANKGTHLPVWGLQLNGAPVGPGAVQARRPYPDFTGISWQQSSGSSIYHGFRAQVKRRFSHGFTGNVSYVFSKGLDSGGDAFYADSSDNLRRNQFSSMERGRSLNDSRQGFAGFVVYELPFFAGSHGAASAILGNWSASGTVQLSSGGPADVTIATNPSNTGNFLDRPDLIADPNAGPNAVNRWFNTAAFAAPVGFSYGNAGRNIIQGPGFASVNLSLLKNIPFGERRRVQFRTEFFNIINKANFDLPNTQFGSAIFGTIGFAGPGRQVQFALRLEF